MRNEWQDTRDSNPQPPVLETGALPIELVSCSGQQWEFIKEIPSPVKGFYFITFREMSMERDEWVIYPVEMISGLSLQ